MASSLAAAWRGGRARKAREVVMKLVKCFSWLVFRRPPRQHDASATLVGFRRAQANKRSQGPCAAAPALLGELPQPRMMVGQPVPRTSRLHVGREAGDDRHRDLAGAARQAGLFGGSGSERKIRSDFCPLCRRALAVAPLLASGYSCSCSTLSGRGFRQSSSVVSHCGRDSHDLLDALVCGS